MRDRGSDLAIDLYSTAPRVQEIFIFIYSHTHTHVRCSKRPAQPYLIEKEKLVRTLCPGVRLDVYFPGFPTLMHITHSARLEKRGVRVFQAASRGDNFCLNILPRDDIPTVCACLSQCVCVCVCTCMCVCECHYSISHNFMTYV